MTPEQARQLLDGTTPGPWEVEVRSYEEDCYADDAIYFWITDHNGNEVAEWRTLEPYAREIGGNCTLMAAAPDMAAMIAGMRAEYAVQVLRSDGWQYSRDTDDFRWHDLSVQIVRADRDHPDEETRLVRRYVTAPQPLGDTK